MRLVAEARPAGVSGAPSAFSWGWRLLRIPLACRRFFVKDQALGKRRTKSMTRVGLILSGCGDLDGVVT